MYVFFFYTMAVLTVSLQFVCQWYFSKGNLKVSYPLTILVYLCYIVMDVGMVMYDPALTAVLIFSLANVWTLVMCTKGIYRLRREQKENDEAANDTSSN